MPNQHPMHIFVSYTGADDAWAIWIARTLRKRGHQVVVQADDFLPGNNFVELMHNGLQQVDRVIAVLSPDYEQSKFASAEWQGAFRRDPTGDERVLIPVRVADYEPTGLLAAIIYVDLVGTTETKAASRLVDAIEGPAATGEATFPGRQSGSRASGMPTPPRLPPHFTGREEALADLLTRLKDGPAAITGVAGIGKSTLARAVVASWPDSSVIWSSGSDETLALQRLADGAGVAPGSTDDATIEAIIAALEAADALLVLDDGSQALSSVLASRGLRRMLVTSRASGGWTSQGIQEISLTSWAIEQTVEFLRRAAPRPDEAGLEHLALMLNGFPLVAAQAASYIDRHGIDYVTYIERLERDAPRALANSTLQAYPHSVLSVLGLSVADVRSMNSAAVDLLCLLSCLAPVEVRRATLTSGASALPESLGGLVADVFALDDMLAALMAQSLITVSDDRVEVHAVVQAFVRLEIENDVADWLRTATSLLGAVAPDDLDDWPPWAEIGPHIDAVLFVASKRPEHVRQIAPLMTDLANACRNAGFVHPALNMMQRLVDYELQHLEDSREYDHLATAVSNLGDHFLGLRLPEPAIATLSMALKIDEAIGRGDSAQAAGCHVGIATALTDQDDFLRAAAELDAAEAILREHPEEVIGHLNLHGTRGRLFLKERNLASAADSFEQALGLARALGDTPREAQTLLYLGNVEMLRGAPGQAESLLTEAVTAAESSAGSPPLMIEALCTLGQVRLQRRDIAGAKDAVEKAAIAVERLPDPDNSIHAGQVCHISGLVLLAMGRGDAAVLSLMDSVSTLVRLLPPGAAYRRHAVKDLTAALDNCDNPSLIRDGQRMLEDERDSSAAPS